MYSIHSSSNVIKEQSLSKLPKIVFFAWNVFVKLVLLITGVDQNMPTIRDPDRYLYMREWSGGMLVGCTVDGHPCFQDGVPESFEFQLLPEDWDLIRKTLKTILVL